MRFLWPVRTTRAFLEEDPVRSTTEPRRIDALRDAFGPGEPGLARENELTRGEAAWRDPAVSAVMLGVMGVGAFTGLGLVHAEAAPSIPLDATRLDAALREEAATLEAASESMSPEERARARHDLWRSFVRGPVASAAEIVGVPISSGVGSGQRNRVEDVRVIQERLESLGFPTATNGRFERSTERSLRIFEALVTGRESISGTTGRIQPGSELHNALSSPNAPRWVKLPAAGPGFVNDDRDGYGHGTNRLVSVITDAGKRYEAAYRVTHPGSALMSLNDASRREGGPNRDHDTHEIGLDLDIRLPKTNGTSGSNVLWREYDRKATHAMIEAFAQDPRVERVLMSDRTLLRTISDSNAPWKHKVVYGGSVHRNHLHIDVSPPDASYVVPRVRTA